MDRVPLETVKEEAIREALGHHQGLDHPLATVKSARLRAMGDMAVYDCLVEVSWVVGVTPAVINFWGVMTTPERQHYTSARMMVQVDAATGEVVGFTESVQGAV